MLNPILKMGQLSQHTAILAQGLRLVTIPKLASEVDQIKGSISNCRSKRSHRLEVELRLIQLAAGVAMDSVGFQGSLTDANVGFSRVAKLCQRFPETAGLLLPSCNKIKGYLSRNGNITGHPIYVKASQEVWWTWPKHGTGSLKLCENGHPYSGTTMMRCPECGSENKDEKLREEIKADMRLRPQDFIAAIKTRKFDVSSYRVGK